MKSKKIELFKIFLFIVVACLLAFIIIRMLPFVKDISTREGQEAFRDELQSMGISGILFMVALQVSQILLVVLPGEPFEVLAGMCYGTLWGSIFIFTTVFITTCIIYFLIKRYKEKYLYNFFKKEKVNKLINSSWYKDSKKTEIILVILFFIPSTPKDLLVYCGALLNIKPLRFILIATFTRFPSVISSTMVGANVAYGNWKTIAFVYGITAIATIFVLVIFNLFDKNKISKDAINSIK